MFRHKNTLVEEKNPVAVVATKSEIAEDVAPVLADGDVSMGNLRELVEKNLKWSQIIYEQNRKINRKLFWYSFFGWVKLAIIAVSIIFAFIYLSPMVRNIWRQYGSLFGSAASPPALSKGNSSDSVDSIIKLLRLSPLQQEQLRQLLK